MEKLPGHIREALAAIPPEKLSRDALLADQSAVESVLVSEVEQFDAALGDALKAICADPAALSADSLFSVARFCGSCVVWTACRRRSTSSSFRST